MDTKGRDFYEPKYIFKDFIYLRAIESMRAREREREKERDHKQGGVVEGEGEADSPLSRKPDAVLDSRTLGS